MANSVNYNTITKQLELNIDQGSTFEHTFTFTNNGIPFDLSNYDARMQVRKTYGTSATIYSGTNQDGKLVFVNAPAGELKVVFAPADTANVKFTNSDDSTLYSVFDLELEHKITHKVYKPASGSITFVREVTR